MTTLFLRTRTWYEEQRIYMRKNPRIQRTKIQNPNQNSNPEPKPELQTRTPTKNNKNSTRSIHYFDNLLGSIREYCQPICLLTYLNGKGGYLQCPTEYNFNITDNNRRGRYTSRPKKSVFVPVIVDDWDMWIVFSRCSFSSYHPVW